MKLPLKKSKRKIKFHDWLLILFIVLITAIFALYWYSFVYRALEYKECNQQIIAMQPTPEMSRNEIIEAVNKLTNSNYKIIWEIGVAYDGRTTLVPFDGRVFLNETLSNNNLVWIYTHEIMHKKLYSANERYVAFETFKTLYESGNEYFRDVALWRASIMWKNEKEYDCTWYVVQYLDGRDTNVLTIRK